MSHTSEYSPELLERAARIKLLLMDCDGVLSNGHIYFLPAPGGGLFETKTFDSQDGIALQWAYRTGIATGIISGRTSPAVEERARSAKMRYLYQGDTRKLPLLEEILEDSGLPAAEVAYIGDDIHRRSYHAQGGAGGRAVELTGRDACRRELRHAVTRGIGCVRDVMELLLKAQNRWSEILALYGIE